MIESSQEGNIMKIFIIICIVLSLPIIAYITMLDDKDICLDSGYCKLGMKININGQEITINKSSCLENNGKLKKNVCIFKN